MDVPKNTSTATRVKLRLDHDIAIPATSLTSNNLSNRTDLKKIFKDVINVEVKDLELDLSMSAVTGLTDLIEDEVFPEQIPMQVQFHIYVNQRKKIT